MKAFLLAAFFALGLSSCSTVHPRPIAPEPAAALPAGARLIITPLHGEPFDMKLDEVRNDTLFGFTRERNVRIPLSGVRSISVRKFALGRTLCLVIPPVAILGSALLVLFVTEVGKTVGGWF